MGLLKRKVKSGNANWYGRAVLPLAAVILSVTVNAASAGWATFRVPVDGGGPAGRSALISGVTFAVAGLEENSFLELSSVTKQVLNAGRQALILEAAGQGLYPDAEELLGRFSGQTGISGSGGNGYAAYQFLYRLSYGAVDEEEAGVTGVCAYARFQAAEGYGNSILIEGEEIFCVRSFAYVDDAGRLHPMERIDFDEEGGFYYYPYPIGAGEELTLAYTLLLPEGARPDAFAGGDPWCGGVPSYELIPARNNATVIRWNVVLRDGAAYPFDPSSAADCAYYPHEISLLALQDPMEAILDTEEEEKEPGNESSPAITEEGSPEGNPPEEEQEAAEGAGTGENPVPQPEESDFTEEAAPEEKNEEGAPEGSSEAHG